MPDPAYMRLVYKDKPIESDLSICGEDNLFEILEARHSISLKDFYQSLGDDWNAIHRPFTVVMEVNSLLPRLFKLHKDCDTEYLNYIEIFWLKKSEDSSKNEFYFKHLLEPVKVFSVKLSYPNIKDRETEKYNHLVEVDFRYRFITVLFMKGHLIAGKYEAKWWFSEFGGHGGLSQERVEELLSCHAISDDAAEWLKNYKKEQADKLRITTDVEIWLKDETGNGISNEPFKILVGATVIMAGKLDENGYAKTVIATKDEYRIEFPLREKDDIHSSV